MDVCGCVGNLQGSRRVSDPETQQKQGLATGSLQVSLKGRNNVAKEETRQRLPTKSVLNLFRFINLFFLSTS